MQGGGPGGGQCGIFGRRTGWARTASSPIAAAADAAVYPSTKTRHLLEQIEAGESFFGMEALAPAFHARMVELIAMAIRGVTHYANPAYLRMFGYEGENQVVGRSLLEQVAPSARADVAERIVRRERGEQLADEYETVGVRQRQWIQHERVERAEERGVRADADGDREDGDDGEARRLEERAAGDFEVRHDGGKIGQCS